MCVGGGGGGGGVAAGSVVLELSVSQFLIVNNLPNWFNDLPYWFATIFHLLCIMQTVAKIKQGRPEAIMSCIGPLMHISTHIPHTHTHTHTHTHNTHTNREWTAQQTAEKERLKMEQQHADHLYGLKACELDQRCVELSQADEETRRAINMATKDYNLALVRVGEGEGREEGVCEVGHLFSWL